MLCLLDGYTILKNSGVVSFGHGHMLDVYRLALGEDKKIVVHVERRETGGTVSECLLYQGYDLSIANQVFNKYSK